MGKLIDLSGQRFGFWLVIKRTENSKSGQTQWLCKCDCGIKKNVTTNSLRSCNSTSCGCNKSEDLKKKKFGNLTVKKADYSKGKKSWLCKCNCGKTIIAGTDDLKSKKVNSCGDAICLPDDGSLYKLDKLITENILKLLSEFKKLSLAHEEINRKQNEISENIKHSIREGRELGGRDLKSPSKQLLVTSKMKCVNSKDITNISINLCEDIENLDIIRY